MLTPARAYSALLTIALGAALVTGCKKDEAPEPVPMPSAAAPAPVKAAEDTPQAAQGSAAGSAEPGEAAPPQAVAPTASEAPKPAGPAPSIDGCCSALQALSKDAKANATVKSKAAQAASMCAATAPLVKQGKAPRSSALTQIRATMVGSAPAACN